IDSVVTDFDPNKHQQYDVFHAPYRIFEVECDSSRGPGVVVSSVCGRVHLGVRSHGNSPSEIQRKGHGLLYEADQPLEDSMAEEQEATVHQRDATSRKNSKNRKSDRGEKGMYVHNLGACSMSSKEDQLIEANDGNPVDRLQLIKEAHTNKKTGQIQDAVIRSIVDLAVPKRKGGRLVGLARRASSYPASSSQVPYTDPMILEQL
uniref:Uncharacterized protein n=1 Tax=Brassica oleracea var. oleracea TaxID=109376 RepID=A0A0D3BGP0_BRAOL